jgi:hypothetical protein
MPTSVSSPSGPSRGPKTTSQCPWVGSLGVGWVIDDGTIVQVGRFLSLLPAGGPTPRGVNAAALGRRVRRASVEIRVSVRRSERV